MKYLTLTIIFFANFIVTWFWISGLTEQNASLKTKNQEQRLYCVECNKKIKEYEYIIKDYEYVTGKKFIK